MDVSLTEQQKADGFDLNRRFVRLVGERSGFVEFEYAIGAPEVFIEMILTPSAYEAFCAENDVEFIENDYSSAGGEDWSWRLADATRPGELPTSADD